jgi:hypothetical protein
MREFNMAQDYIVEEIRRIREDQAAKFKFDIKAILAAARDDSGNRSTRSFHSLQRQNCQLNPGVSGSFEPESDPWASSISSRPRQRLSHERARWSKANLMQGGPSKPIPDSVQDSALFSRSDLHPWGLKGICFPRDVLFWVSEVLPPPCKVVMHSANPFCQRVCRRRCLDLTGRIGH